MESLRTSQSYLVLTIVLVPRSRSHSLDPARTRNEYEERERAGSTAASFGCGLRPAVGRLVVSPTAEFTKSTSSACAATWKPSPVWTPPRLRGAVFRAPLQ